MWGGEAAWFFQASLLRNPQAISLCVCEIQALPTSLLGHHDVDAHTACNLSPPPKTPVPAGTRP